ncbi:MULTISPECIES: hypothetical protein [Geobacillus]|jgi:hypothetical protein|uniref:Uncharacterized protein n=1 Tax=Geobacillus thermodenitrificans TaxID=33940 RepID=A0ABY9QDT4_GEOTD|nr:MULTISPECIES: hypothetical protein [Geobacillus]ARP41848.1 hypothetical protein GTHT12_00283 [Geobacillus thermodenitrificans]KQB94447.1 hypothetical protein GEPA3_0807 [Geobacillus sp. PA-3]MEC5189040.1 hypothetical protein [Geobacillus thermodenitrificans]MED3717608.1 hypothetical protein [Geobacillus thermodenitrificans]MED3906446.1 hypothetical protein [Geobacillus thermodenitrificans]
MENKRTKTTDEEIQIQLKADGRPERARTTDEEISIQFMFDGGRLTHQPKDYEEIEY